jgi:hypothetical protein
MKIQALNWYLLDAKEYVLYGEKSQTMKKCRMVCKRYIALN